LNRALEHHSRDFKQLWIILLVPTIVTALLINSDNALFAQPLKNDNTKREKIEINATLNPDSVSPGEKSSLVVSITNRGNSIVRINSIELSQSWNITSLNFLDLFPNRTVLKSIDLKIPVNLSSGKYNLFTKISTEETDYTLSTALTVTRIVSLPLSENIPLSILVLLFSGIITYSVSSHIITGTFKRNYVEVGMWSAGLGFLNWGVLFILREVIKISTSLELIHYDFYAIVAIMSIGLAIGISSGIAYKLIVASVRILREKNIIKQRESSLYKEGFWTGDLDDPMLHYFISDHWKTIRESLGINYSVTVNVHLKTPVNTKSFLTGSLYGHGNEESPDMLLQPKYIIRATTQEVNNAMNEEEVIEELKQNLHNFKIYRNKVTTLLQTLDIQERSVDYLPDRIIREMKNCTKTRDLERYLKIVYSFDFSRYSHALIALLNKPVITQGDGPIHIQGDNILSVEIIKYEHAFGISLTDFHDEVIPKVYDKSEIPMATSQEDIMIKDYYRRQSISPNMNTEKSP
jgi:hypothetical protein